MIIKTAAIQSPNDQPDVPVLSSLSDKLPSTYPLPPHEGQGFGPKLV